MKKFRIFLISACILFAGYIVVKACAGGDYEEGYNSNFTPQTFVDTTYAPFFYSEMFYYGINYDEGQDTRFNESNISDWQSYLGKGMNKETITYLLTQADYATIKIAYNFYLGKNALPDSLKKFSSIMNVNSTKEKLMLQYLTIAKSCENFSTDNAMDAWYDTIPEKKYALDNVNAKTIETLMEQSSDHFIKERYWFQLVRFNFFNTVADCVPSFEKYKKDFEYSLMYYRSMDYAAGAFYKQKNYSKANYYYSLVFAGNDALKVTAHRSFHPQEEKDWQETLALCVNNKERITLWTMLGIYYGDELRSMKEIYQIEPASKSMDLLLTRAINKNESIDSVNSKAFNDNFDWCKKIISNDKIGNPFLWNISAGYLAYLKNDYTTAKQYFKNAVKKMPNTSLAKDQLRLMLLLNKVGSLKTITAADENEILPDLKWLYEFEGYNYSTTEIRTSNAQEYIKSTLAAKYRSQGNFIKSECFVSLPSFYVSEKNVNDFKAYFQQKQPSAFDLYCMNFSEKKETDLWEYQAIQATFKDELDNAITFMIKVDSAKETILAGNPFNGKIQDCHDCDHAQKQKVKYNKLTFLQKMKELKDNVNTGNDVYNNALLLANGYYNITHFGNARYFYEGIVLGSDQGEPETIDSVFRRMLMDNSLATKYYTIALQHAGNDEQKAKSLYMLAKCERNNWYNKTFFNFTDTWEYKDNKDIDFITWNSFKALRQYKNTQYYKDVIRECGYFRTAMSH